MSMGDLYVRFCDLKDEVRSLKKTLESEISQREKHYSRISAEEKLLVETFRRLSDAKRYRVLRMLIRLGSKRKEEA